MPKYKVTADIHVEGSAIKSPTDVRTALSVLLGCYEDMDDTNTKITISPATIRPATELTPITYEEHISIRTSKEPCFTVELARYSFDGTCYANCFDGTPAQMSAAKELPEYVPFRELKIAFKKKLGLTLPPLKKHIRTDPECKKVYSYFALK